MEKRNYMNIRIGEKIKFLRKQKNISHEVLAQYLGVSFQAVSKWENETTMPDITMVPAIASFFGVSTDELFDFNLLEIEQNVEKICKEAYHYRENAPTKSEEILRNGLKKYPGNDILLNNLLYTMRFPERSAEVISLCKSLIESTKYDDVRYDALRILAETYKEQGEYELVRVTLEKIPEIYFTKLELQAELLNGKEMAEAATKQLGISLDSALEMSKILAFYYETAGNTTVVEFLNSITQSIIESVKIVDSIMN